MAFGVIFYYRRKNMYANESDPFLKKKMIRRSFWIGFGPLILAIFFWLGSMIYFWTNISGDL